MKKKTKIIISGLILYLLLLTIVTLSIVTKSGTLSWQLLLEANVVVMIRIIIAAICIGVTCLLFNWIEK